MQFDIVIPSYHRPEKLHRCLESIAINFQQNSSLYQYVNVKVYFSDSEDYSSCKYGCHWFSKGMFPDYQASRFWNSHLLNMTSDVLITINDDVVLPQNTLWHLIRSYETLFPTRDGVLGMNQINIPDAKEYSFVAIGSSFSDRFPDRQVFCPDYERFFADEELEMYAQAIGKFFFDPEAKIIHHHASFSPELLDETHYSVRQYWQQDHQTFKRRRDSGYLWGRDFNRLTEREKSYAV